MKKPAKIILISVLSAVLVIGTVIGIIALINKPQEPTHTHAYSTVKYDTVNHWNECECGEKANKEEHTFVNNKCECGYEKSTPGHEHSYSELKFDNQKHWCECSCGAKSGEEEHKGGTATCTEKAKCEVCATEYGELKAHEHTELKYDNTNHWYECECGDKKDIEAHIPGAAATETTAQECTVCGFEIVPALNHVHNLHLEKADAQPASCTKLGNKEYYVCSCGRWYCDKDAEQEIIDRDEVIIPKLDHEYENLKYNSTTHWYECDCSAQSGLETHKGGTTTCTEKAKCEVCGQEYGSVKAHEYDNLKYNSTTHWYECDCGAQSGLETHKGGTATCTEKAKCEVCGYEYSDVVSCSYSEWETATLATCTSNGQKYKECIWCGDKITSVIPALGHNMQESSRKDATCTTAGWVKYSCTRCSYTTEVVIPSGTHDIYVAETQQATCTVDGYIKYACNKCSYTHTETVAGGHVYQVSEQKQATKTEAGYIKYKCINCDSTYQENISAIGEGNYVLLVQDRVPWTTDNAVALMKLLDEDGYISGWSQITSSALANADLSLYSIIYISNDQTTATYNQLGAQNEKLTEFVENGGVLIYGACDHGWAAGNISYNLPGGVTRSSYYSRHNYIVDNDHDIIMGALTDGNGIDNYLLQGTYCSHSGFVESTLPENTEVITEDEKGLPTLISYPIGAGQVIASGLTWEFYYSRSFVGDTTYSKNVFDDLIVYATTLTNVCDHVLIQGATVQSTCISRGYTEYTCSECGATIRKNYTERLPLVHVEKTAATCTVDGNIEYWYCAECGTKYNDEEQREEIDNVVIKAGHTGVAQWVTDKTTHVKRYTCCGEIVVSASNHSFSNGTCNVCGYICVHIGGEATCKAIAICSICGTSYGTLSNHVYVSGVCKWCGEAEETEGETYTRNGDIIYFGSYPQTEVTDSTTTSALLSTAGNPINSTSGWTSYNYYVNSVQTDCMYYKDVEYSGEKYRGVYIKNYRPYYFNYSSSADYTYQDDNGHTTNSVYWFKYEVLEWRILDESKGLILCEDIIDAQAYQDTYANGYNNNTGTPSGTYVNNYKYSTIRKWLNETFYETAFNSLQQAIIKTVEVDNSARSTNPDNNATQWNSGVNNYACENTSDKVFLLSMQEVTKSAYGFSTDYSEYDTARRKQTSDYAQSQGAFTSTSSSYLGNGYWWLRSSSYSYSDCSRYVCDGGYVSLSNYYVYRSNRGVVPALQIQL